MCVGGWVGVCVCVWGGGGWVCVVCGGVGVCGVWGWVGGCGCAMYMGVRCVSYIQAETGTSCKPFCMNVIN